VVSFILSYWEKKYDRVPDAFVVEGPLAGGHLGFPKDVLLKNPPLLEQIVAEIAALLKPWEMKYKREIPIIAGGGVFSGGDIKRIFAAGAKAVQMATRFVATHECDASPAFKQAYLDCRKEDIALIDSPVGMTGRAILGPFLEAVVDGMKKPFRCVWHCIKSCDVATAPYCIAAALMQARYGSFINGFAFCGANAYRIDRLLPVRELVENLKREYEKA
jgi:nitronate monooxygenase